MRVLLIEPDGATARSLELMLKSEGFNVYTTDLGEEGIDLARLYDYDAVLLELVLPDISGFEVARKLRAVKVCTPLLIVSGLAGIEEKVKALGHGADDYLTKPFHRDELVARIHAVVRRMRGHAVSKIECGALAVDIGSRTAHYDGERLPLTSKEYELLELLALRQGSCVTKDAVLNYVYGGLDEPEVKIVDVFVCKLRKKLNAFAGGELQFIETVWGRGYMMPVRPFERSTRQCGRPAIASPVLNPRPGTPTRPAAHATA